MKLINKVLAISAISLSLMPSIVSADCGKARLADFDWSSSNIHTAIAGLYTLQMAYDLLKILPALILGSWLGVKIYHVLNGEVFRRTILGLILTAGLVLLI